MRLSPTPRSPLWVFAGLLLLAASAALCGEPAAVSTDPPQQPADFRKAAGGAPPAVAAAYQTLAEPNDRLKLADGEVLRVQPLPTPPSENGPLTVQVLNGAEAPLERSLPAGDVAVFTPYEDQALAAAQALLANDQLQPAERTRAAEAILSVALRFHQATRDRSAGQANPWAAREVAWREKLREVRRQHLHIASSEARGEEDWKNALALAERLAALDPYDKALRAERVNLWARWAEDRVKAGDYPTARAYLARIDGQLPDFPAAQVVREGLRRQAQALFKEAQGLKDKAALLKLQEALAAWPQLPGLRDEWLKVQGTYKVLNVGVRRLPERLSPATAWTDPEKQAVDLLFERLVQEEYDGEHGERFRPELAERPEVVADGRRFRLRPEARWSDGKRVTALDVRRTVELLQAPDLPGRSPQWADQVKLLEIESDLTRVEFRLRQGSLTPLAPLTFPVLPQTLDRANSPEFAEAPVGSGPYRYAGRRTVAGRSCAVFTANPHYQRPDHPERPAIREIRFYVSADPAADFRDRKEPLHLLVDFPTNKISELQAQGVRDVRTLEDRRVYFLAVNHRVAALRNNDLRRALAHGIDREAILNSCFRGGNPVLRRLAVAGAAAGVAAQSLGQVHAEYHRPLNGPYPPKSWACAEPRAVPPRLHDQEKARSLLRLAKEKLPKVELTLKYPDDDPRVAQACREIARQLAELGTAADCPLTVTPVGLPPREFRQALDLRNYELAYHHHDYDSEAYWLGGLFDDRQSARDPGGPNYLGYENDSKLQSMFHEAASRRQFKEVQKITHNIHAHLHDVMPLIPLWQLDVHVAVHPDLEAVILDPLHPFSHAAEWQLLKK